MRRHYCSFGSVNWTSGTRLLGTIFGLYAIKPQAMQGLADLQNKAPYLGQARSGAPA